MCFLGNMKKKESIKLNQDKVPTISMGDPTVISGSLFDSKAGDKNSGWHRHNVALLTCIEAGIKGMRTDKESLIVSSGMMSFIPANFNHSQVGMGMGLTGWYITLPADRIPFMPDEFCILELSDLLLLLGKRICSWGPNPRERSSEQKRLVATFLDELRTAKRASHFSVPFPGTKSLCLVAKRVMDDPSDMKNIDHWAHVAAMSRRTFTKRFREETGLSFAKWRMLVKLQASIKMLAGGKSVTEVAFDLGYQNTSNFILTFRRQLGLPPMQYLRRIHA